MCTVVDLEEKDYFAHLKMGKWEIQKLRFLQDKFAIVWENIILIR